jgi:uncharacterized protein
MLEAIRVVLLLLLTAIAIPGYADAGGGCPSAAEQPTAEMMQAAKLNARDHGFLWRISKDGRTSFLYGTMHVGKFDWAFPGPSVMQALRASDTVALELDMLDADMQNRLLTGMATMHSSALPKSLAERMRQQAEFACVPYDAIAKLSPEMQIDMLTLMVGRREGLDASYATDAVLAGIGHGANKNVVSLETPEAQLQLMQLQDRQQTIALVQDSLEELESGRSRTMLIRIARVWADADYADMEHFDEWCECLNTGIEREMMRRLLDERNPNLADRIDALHSSGKRVFAAVGSLHMFGPIGLPTLMAERGYRVERVDFRPK